MERPVAADKNNVAWLHPWAERLRVNITPREFHWRSLSCQENNPKDHMEAQSTASSQNNIKKNNYFKYGNSVLSSM